jgi:hypothetical protein
MRLVIALLLAFSALASADPMKPFAGKIVITKEAPPKAAGELADFLAANVSKDGSYELIGGNPWDMNLVAVLPKDATGTVTLEFLDAGKPLQAIDVAAKGKLVIAHAQATTAAGFAAHKTYALRITSGKTVLAKAELFLRE